MERRVAFILSEYWRVPKAIRKEFGGRFGCPAYDENMEWIGFCKTYPQEQYDITLEMAAKTVFRCKKP